MMMVPRRRAPFHFATVTWLLCLALATANTVGQEVVPLPNALAQAAESKSPVKSVVQPGETPSIEVVPAQPPVALTEAELITRLQRTIASNEKQVEELRCEVADPSSEYYKAEGEFRALEERFSQEKAALAKLLEVGEVDDAAKLKVALVDTEKSWMLSRERFDLAIVTRKTLQEQISALENKLLQDRQALDKLTGEEPPVVAPAKQVVEAKATVAKPLTMGEAADPTAATAAATTKPVTTPPTSAQADAAGIATSLGLNEPKAKPPSQEMIAAKADADVKQQAVVQAEQDVRTVSDRLAALEKNISIEQKLLAAGRKKADLANQSRLAAEDEYQKKSAEGLMGNQLAEIASRRSDSERQFQDANNEVRSRMDRLQELQGELTALQSEELAALQAAKARQNELTMAEAKLGQLKNPFSLQNLIQWLLNHGPTLSMILTIMYALHKVTQLSTRRVVDLMVQSTSRSAPEENEARVNTLAGVFQNAASLTIIIGGAIMVFEEAGIAVAPLMGGAAVLGLAVAFGAQNLIRDYFYGFVILLENQYKINDVLKIGEVSGQVERITLRMTVLRDLEGCVHFIPNGKIDCVSNMTHGWSRAVFDVGISHKEDPDRIMNTLLDLACELKQEPEYARLIIDDPEMLGVDKLDSNGLTIKFVIKTRPLKQWAVKRELQRRIKRRFTELGIDLAMPQQFVLRDESHFNGLQSGETLTDSSVVDLPRRAA
ncbi:putative MscS family protein YkuT [Anatilimnocola aggregata]|uniref:Putative MscS family protein YkuT n=1 Tax=Anatilimnocola aggregata TaxID=2528021 RepID=A0A517Y9F8_9BACT|nr:mechanosensitive ion channel family protein [Anatilimnocola aggregata]QDU26856.1 putative MscS family protein YkuT [Anatilimnocola aggregata]